MFSNLSSKVSFFNRLFECLFILYIGCNRIDCVESFSHLGHIIKAKLDDVSDIIKSCNDFIGQVTTHFARLKI